VPKAASIMASLCTVRRRPFAERNSCKLSRTCSKTFASIAGEDILPRQRVKTGTAESGEDAVTLERGDGGNPRGKKPRNGITRRRGGAENRSVSVFLCVSAPPREFCFAFVCDYIPPQRQEKKKSARGLRQSKATYRCCIPALAGFPRSQSIAPGEDDVIHFF